MEGMRCPGCFEEMSKIRKDGKEGFECYSCGAYTLSFKTVHRNKKPRGGKSGYV